MDPNSPTLRPAHWLVLAGLVATVLAGTAPRSQGAVTAADAVRKSVDARADGVVQIDHPTGTLVVSGWDRTTVEVTGRVGRGAESALVERRGERVLVRMDQSLWQGEAADLDVRVPAGSRLEVRGMSLDVRISGVAGDIDANVLSGTLRVTGANTLGAAPAELQRTHLDTVSGVIQADGTFGDLELSAVSGPLGVDGAVRSLTTESGSGPQVLKLRGAQRVDVDSLNGPIHLDLVEPATGVVVRGNTFNGVLHLGLPAATSATVEARARSGRIENRLGGDEEWHDEDGFQASLTTRLGSPEAAGRAARVELSTHRGDIVLRPVR